MKKAAIEKKQVSWFRPDLAYEHLHGIKTAVTSYAGTNDLSNWYNALEAEYRLVWGLIEKRATANKHTEKWFEEQWKEVRGLLYDSRYALETPFSDRLMSTNYAKVRELLHTLNMTINKYEIEANLNILQENEKKQGMDKIRESYKLETEEREE